MTTAVERYEELKQQIEDLTRNKDQAKGQLDLLLKQLKETTGCATLKEAKTKLRQMEKETAQAQKEFNDALETFENEWEEILHA